MTLPPLAGDLDSTQGYKVDISRGQRIGRVSSEWFSRPDDERYLSLTELHAAVRRRAEAASTRTVETKATHGARWAIFSDMAFASGRQARSW